MSSFKRIGKSFTIQQDHSDCGVACLQSIIRYYGGFVTLETLRGLSGTSGSGTTLLGLYQCSTATGFDAEGVQMDVEHLLLQKEPVILHVDTTSGAHFIISYGREQTKSQEIQFLIGDPASGIRLMSCEVLKEIWKSRTALLLKPNASFCVRKPLQARFNWLYGAIKEHLPIIMITIFLGFVITILGLSISIFSQKLVDTIIPENKTEQLLSGLILLFLILLVRAALTYLRKCLLLKAGVEINQKITTDFLSNLLFLPKSFFDGRRTGDLVNRFADPQVIHKSLAWLTGSLLSDFFMALATLFALFYYSFYAGLTCLAILPVVLLASIKFTPNVKSHQHQSRSGLGRTESAYIDSVRGILSLKASGRESHFLGIIADMFSRYQHSAFQLGIVTGRFELLLELAGIVVITSAIAVTSFYTVSQRATTGEMVAVLSLSASFLPPLFRLAGISLALQETFVALERMDEFTAIKPEDQDHCINKSILEMQVLTVKGLSFRFPGRRAILKELSLTVRKGEILLLSGENGSGKSTFLQLLLKFYKPESGVIVVNGTDLQHIDTSAWRSMISVVPQEVTVFTGTLAYNITLGRSCTTEQFVSFCNHYRFDQYFLKFPQGYNTMLGEDGVKLSGGQKQLLALARALFSKPQLLLLDEPTAAMDDQMQDFVHGILCELKKQAAIIMISHRREAVTIADRIIRMNAYGLGFTS